ncbi:methyltransferase domain-containing protein [Pedobacter sp. SYSU D00535]|uniref:methyltransferase domain-containing protein n=1 Tax=Pedobacter sp. SYSU D00535 TaxID=2810308 RepID=UPI001A962FA9|nr:methyltransferase domain-containing protein [Pedobacter sp. SYSU D00535]
MKTILKSILKAGKQAYVKHSQAYFRITGHKVDCNICHYRANRLFSDCWHRYVSCPSCGSGVRHRLVWATSTLLQEHRHLFQNKQVLHFAPNEWLGKRIRAVASEYKTADLLAEGYAYPHIDYNIDISKMTILEGERFDCIVACDVLEHVPQQLAAIQEMFRVLKPGGFAVLTVPQRDDLEFTLEDLSISDPQLRKKMFGQEDHLRIYGRDFPDLLSSQGFQVRVVDAMSFEERIRERYVLYPPVASPNPLATNNRKVYLAMKAA